MKRVAASVLIGAVVMLTGVASMARQQKVDICHVPPGNPDNAHTINVAEPAVDAHLAHGDFVGTCECVQDGDCVDQDLCTTDSCDAGQCVSRPVVCGPGEVCNPATGTCEVPPSVVTIECFCIPGFVGITLCGECPVDDTFCREQCVLDGEPLDRWTCTEVAPACPQ